MISGGALAPAFEVFDTEILPKRGPGRLYRVAAVAGTNEGRRPTFFVADELHEWEGAKERVHLVLSNGRAKRVDAWELAVSTAGRDSGSLLGRLYAHGKRVLAGEAEDERFLFEWLEGPGDVDFGDRDALKRAILTANPAAGPGGFLPLENVIRKAREIPEHEFQRYYLNRWVAAPERWITAEAWASLADPAREVPDGAQVVLGFDGSYAKDSTAIVGVTLGERPHLFVVGCWENPNDPEWRVPIGDVEAAIAAACVRWNVKAVGCDPPRWARSLQVLSEAGLPMVEWPSHSVARMAPACSAFEDAVFARAFTHDGDERLAKHIANCVTKTDARGRRITKDHKDSRRHIDLAVAAVIALDVALRGPAQRRIEWALI